MSRLKCNCGNSMSNSDVPSKNVISVFKKSDVELALKQTPMISLFDYETSGREELEYWYCTECRRVHIVENVPNGRVIKRYIVSNAEENISLENTEAIYVFTASEIYDAEENNFKITLADYIKEYGEDHLYYLDPDDNKIYRKTGDQVGTLVYEKEE